ncbi:hypothetical protein E2562_000485 [Oryza meyeriana var. granulata]|uniref:Germin-like protein n=1 Tax=Oryza meyeriana var. granulata TaxID=110450 RepID=A0A6G1CDD1_9ORYZ|nr:hypothetical protein E2562_000485 [Oryza meyeriana var. granulata]
MDVIKDHFFKAAMLDTPRNTIGSKVGSNVTLIGVLQLPSLNTLGISIARIDYAPLGENPPHMHPRATEILMVLEGTLCVVFITSNLDNKLFSKVLNKGKVFVFPIGLIHFQFNPNPYKPIVAVVALSSQNPGAMTISNVVFGSKPPISNDVLAKAFQVTNPQEQLPASLPFYEGPSHRCHFLRHLDLSASACRAADKVALHVLQGGVTRDYRLQLECSCAKRQARPRHHSRMVLLLRRTSMAGGRG